LAIFSPNIELFEIEKEDVPKKFGIGIENVKEV